MKGFIILLLAIISFCYVFLYDEDIISKKDDSTNIFLKKDIKEGNINIIGLNNYDKSSFTILKETVEKFRFKCSIKESIRTNYRGNLCSMYQNELKNNLYFDFDQDQPITIYVTNTELIDKNIRVSGLCYGNIIYIKNSTFLNQTITHELLHCYGLEHCENRCIMSINNRDRWDNIVDMPIFCDDCKSKAPSQFIH